MNRSKRKEKIKRYFAFFLALNILFEVVSPTMAWAITSGTYQPEYLSFEPAGASEMVDLFTGDFKYNIPLMDVDGYPLNLSYHAGVGMEQEASWVGLGWSLNAGASNRLMKGLPDDFNGDTIKSETYIKPKYSVGVGGDMSKNRNGSVDYLSIGGIGYGIGLTEGLMIMYNNYKGFGLEYHKDQTLSGSISVIGGLEGGQGGGVSVSSMDGATITDYSNKGYQILIFSKNVGVGTSVNTRTGDQTKYFSGSTNWGIGPVNIGSGTSHMIPAGSVAYSPNISNSYKGIGASIAAKFGFYYCIGFSIYGINMQSSYGKYVGLNGVVNYTELANTKNDLPGFGYMNMENANKSSLLDFNRDKDGTFFYETPHAPMSSYTYDMFSATAQGLYHNFRTHRSDIGTVYDNSGYILSTSKHKGVEIGVGLFAHFLLDIQNSVNIGSSGEWNSSLSKSLNYYNPDITTSTNRYYEKNYMKVMGEMTAHDPTFSGNINGEAVVHPQLGLLSGTTADAINSFSGNPGVGGSIKRNNKRDIRKTNIVYLNAKEAENFALEKQIKNYPMNSCDLDTTNRNVDNATFINRTSLTGTEIDHHISEMSITKDDGSRYFYGIPVYNLSKKKVIFNASDAEKINSQSISLINKNIDLGGYSYGSPLTKNAAYEMVEYTSTETSKNNRRGLDNYYHTETLPAYAQSYLLTAIVSPDYVDLTGNGPTYDDLGEYTKFNYTKTDSLYRWKIPYGIPGSYPNMAALDRGLLADDLDDKGYYECGERQVWYLHSIETKNYVAEFILGTSLRNDMMGVTGEVGATHSSSKSRYYLEKINLYSKAEKMRYQKLGGNLVPIKTVNFQYDYSLCPNVFNNTNSGDGKLTLKKVSFTYGTSKKSELSPYRFAYADSNHDGNEERLLNPVYDPKGVDRWGNVKRRGSDNLYASGTSGKLNFDEFPYSEQKKDSADVYTAAWNLSTIYTPTGSQINVDYESDDYGYVQDKPAGQMVMLKDIVNSYSGWSPSAGTNTNITTSKYFILDLERLEENGIKLSLSSGAASAIVKTKVLNNTKELYYKCFTKLNSTDLMPGNTTRYYDYVSGYAEIDYNEVGIINTYNYTRGSNTYYKYAYVAVKLDGHKDDNTGVLINPLVKAGWQMLRTYLPKIAYPGSETNNLGTNGSTPLNFLLSIMTGISTAWFDLQSSKSGDPNIRFLMKKYCSQVAYDKSWVRVFSPYKKKIGGGHRVKQITMSDNWNVMSGENESTYGQTYDYTTKEGVMTISSGVTNYEPIVGADEISLRKPVDFSVPHRYAPNDHYFMEEPLGEMFYPSPLVGYSKVTIRNINYTYSGSDVCPIGQTTYEFYTAKDFPVQTQNSGIIRASIDPEPIDKYTIMTEIFKSLSFAEGYVLKFNDMHGKLKGTYSFAQDNLLAPISGTTYYYSQAGKSLKQTVSVIDQSKAISSTTIGREIDAVTDLRQNKSLNIGTGDEYYLDIGACLAPLFGTKTIGGSQTVAFQSAVTTKIVQQYGILTKVESFDIKSKVTMQNLLWDKNTGDVVLTQTTNNFEAPVYTFNYPAYWMYKEMGGAYQRQNIKFKITTPGSTTWDLSSGVLNNSFVSGILKDGDEVSVTDAANLNIRAWVVYENQLSPPSGGYKLVDVDGDLINNSYSGISSATAPFIIKVLRPVERNQFNYSAGSVTTLHNPFVSTGGSGTPDLDDDVLSASAIEYCSKWNVYCAPVSGEMSDCLSSGSGEINPYTNGLSGNWRPWKTYAYKTDRNYNTSQPNMKNDGTFKKFTPYWLYPGKWKSIFDSTSSYDRWVLNSENTAFTPNGNLVESKDAIGLYHAQLYGFNHTLLSSKANNSKASQIAYDGFEDYKNIYDYGYGFMTSCAEASQNNFKLAALINGGSGQPSITDTVAHTGRNSLVIGTSTSFAPSYTMFPASVNSTFEDKLPPRCVTRPICTNNLILEGGKYVTSFWVKAPVDTTLDMSSHFVFQISGSGVTAISSRKTKVINGWQKFDYYFTTPSTGTGSITFTFDWPVSPALPYIYLDDWRIQPFNSTMTSYVYDPIHLRPWAELDDRNFATIIEYDNEGKLVRTKKETERGIYTITENRNSIIKQ